MGATVPAASTLSAGRGVSPRHLRDWLASPVGERSAPGPVLERLRRGERLSVIEQLAACLNIVESERRCRARRAVGISQGPLVEEMVAALAAETVPLLASDPDPLQTFLFWAPWPDDAAVPSLPERRLRRMVQNGHRADDVIALLVAPLPSRSRRRLQTQLESAVADHLTSASLSPAVRVALHLAPAKTLLVQPAAPSSQMNALSEALSLLAACHLPVLRQVSPMWSSPNRVLHAPGWFNRTPQSGLLPQVVTLAGDLSGERLEVFVALWEPEQPDSVFCDPEVTWETAALL